jgi:hypothetical protein
MEALGWNIRLVMQRGVGVASSGVGFLNCQTTKRDYIALVEGVAGGVVYKVGLQDTGQPRQVYLNHVPKVSTDQIRGFSDLPR